jgi:XTP/dITP diphosphohydrolase
MELVFASANKNKIREIRQILPPHYTLLGLEDIGITEEIPEPGKTIKENSFLKADYVVRKLKQQGRNIPVFADDSGLEVTALNGEPGVNSAYYAGLPRNDEANNQKLLKELSDKTDRNARFVTVITLIMNEEVHSFEGEVKGSIAHELSGKSGFGYDPLFIPEGAQKTFAEFTAEEKNAISHRGRAVRKLMEFLSQIL